ncbi:hypothetical protein NST14_12010 [Bacillus sp. FSL W8-0519]|uniref:ParM/StbA family protein n=1 Tax=Bacillus sp. FSL W8-0519 TaxID=2954624 RepID=UPI0009361BC4
MEIVVVDAGNKEVKGVTKEGVFSFNSFLGEARKRRLETNYQDEMIGIYNGVNFFAGELAERESEFPRNSMGLSKAHEDAKLRILIAIHRFSKTNDVKLIVGQPIEMHDEIEKAEIKSMLTGIHTLILNGVEKRFQISRAEVAAEGAASYWCIPEEPFVRIIDAGSGTINIATVKDGQFIDKESFTLGFGAESTKTRDIGAMGSGVISALNRFNRHDPIRIGGGIAEKLKPIIESRFTDCKVIRPSFESGSKVTKLHSKYANAIGMYNLAKVVYGCE